MNLDLPFVAVPEASVKCVLCFTSQVKFLIRVTTVLVVLCPFVFAKLSRCTCYVCDGSNFDMYTVRLWSYVVLVVSVVL